MTADDVRDLRRAAELLREDADSHMLTSRRERLNAAITLERLAAVQEPKIGILPPCIACGHSGHIVPFHYAQCRFATPGSQR
jgi:hypothetical protein